MRLYWQRCSSLLVLYVLSWQSTAFFVSAQKDASTLNQWRGFSTRPRQRNGKPVARTLVSASATRTIPADKQNINLTTTTTTLNFWEHMICGATARSLAKTMFHPANVAKTILQTSSSAASPSSPAVVATLLSEKPSQVASSSSSSPVTLMSLVRNRPRVLLRGTAAQFILSAIQGAVTFAIVEETRHVMERTWQQNKQQPATQQQQQASTRPTSTTTAASMDFASSVVSTAAASIVSVPQMVIMDNLMAGNYPHLGAAVTRLYQERGGIGAFYRNWGPHLMGKIPAYVRTCCFVGYRLAKNSVLNFFQCQKNVVPCVLLLSKHFPRAGLYVGLFPTMQTPSPSHPPPR